MSRDPWDPLGPFSRKVTKIPRYGGLYRERVPKGPKGSRTEQRREPGQSNGGSVDLFRNLLRTRPTAWDRCKVLYTAEFACTLGGSVTSTSWCPFCPDSAPDIEPIWCITSPYAPDIRPMCINKLG